MPYEDVNILQLHEPVFESGAVLFAYLAFPDKSEEARRAEVHAGLCHLALRAEAAENPQSEWSPQLIKPGYALLTEKEVRRAVSTVDRRLSDRLKAAIVAKPFLEEATTSKPPQLPTGVNRLSIDKMAEYVMFRSKKDPDTNETKNFHARVWKPSLPVIHLAVALNVLFERTRVVGLEKLKIEDLVRSPEAIEFLIDTARPLEDMLPQISRLNIEDDTLIRFRLS